MIPFKFRQQAEWNTTDSTCVLKILQRTTHIRPTPSVAKPSLAGATTENIPPLGFFALFCSVVLGYQCRAPLWISSRPSAGIGFDPSSIALIPKFRLNFVLLRVGLVSLSHLQ